jgi:hypothetical protein
MMTVVNIYLLVMMICRYQYDLEEVEVAHGRQFNNSVEIRASDVEDERTDEDWGLSPRSSMGLTHEVDIEMPVESENCLGRLWRWIVDGLRWIADCVRRLWRWIVEFNVHMMEKHPVHFVQLQLLTGLAVVASIGKLMKTMTHEIGFAGNLDPRPSGTCVSSSGMPSGHAITAVFALVFQLGFFLLAKNAGEKELEKRDAKELEEAFVQEAVEERNGESDKLLPFIKKSLIAIAFYGPIPFARVWLQDHTWEQIGIGAAIGLLFVAIPLYLMRDFAYSNAHAFDTFTFFHREVNKKYDNIYSDIDTGLTLSQKLRGFFVKESYFNRLKWGVHVTTFLAVFLIIGKSLIIG